MARDGGGGGESGRRQALRLQNDLRTAKEELSRVGLEIQTLINRKRDLEKKVGDIGCELELINEGGASISHFDREDFPWSSQIKTKLKTVFHLHSFRYHQKAAINATMEGLDLLLIMPTGGGKSLTFQLPALCTPGVTLVVSPLISLMQDQLHSLQLLGINTAVLNTHVGKEEVKRVVDAMIDPNSELALLYVTPEKLAKSKRFMSQLEKMYRMGRFVRLVIDEVHCCSSWGHDFRPDYKFLGIMKTQYPKTPIIGLTATATANVIVDIQKMLNMEGCLVLRDSFYRPNLKYRVIDSPSKEKVSEIAHLIQTQFSGSGRGSCQSGIIYCLTVKECDDLRDKLVSLGIKCDRYHAQLEPEERSLIQQRWFDNKLQVIIATVAFGMGINKLDVRFVIHHSMSKSLENYYQESGRAGRDGLLADCILYYSFHDSFRASALMFTEKNGIRNVYNMLKYSLDQEGCRKQFIANHFGDPCDEIKEGCNSCDNCEVSRGGRTYRKEIKINAATMLMDILKILEHACSVDERMTPLKLVDSLFGKGNKKLRVESVKVPKVDRELIEKILGLLLIDGYLEEDFHFTPYSTISYILPGGNKNNILGQKGDLFYTFYYGTGSGGSGYSTSSIETSRESSKGGGFGKRKRERSPISCEEGLVGDNKKKKGALVGSPPHSPSKTKGEMKEFKKEAVSSTGRTKSRKQSSPPPSSSSTTNNGVEIVIQLD